MIAELLFFVCLVLWLTHNRVGNEISLYGLLENATYLSVEELDEIKILPNGKKMLKRRFKHSQISRCHI